MPCHAIKMALFEHFALKLHSKIANTVCYSSVQQLSLFDFTIIEHKSLLFPAFKFWTTVLKFEQLNKHFLVLIY